MYLVLIKGDLYLGVIIFGGFVIIGVGVVGLVLMMGIIVFN